MPVSEQTLIERACALAPSIRERAAETARNRRPHDDTIRELIEAGIIQMVVPTRFGGSEASLRTVYEVIRTISAACPSTGWISAFYIMHNTYAAKFPEQTQQEVFGKKGYTLLPAASAPNMSATRVDGGWQVSGRAIWGSGIMHADWVMMSGEAEGGPRTFIMPADDVEVLDTWHYTGMSGTGSADYVANEVFVPDHRSMTMDDFFSGNSEGGKLHANPLYRMPFFVAAYCTILPVIAGSYAGAVDAYRNIIERRVRNFVGSVVKDQQNAHVKLGEFRIISRVADDLASAVYDQTLSILGTRDYTLDDRLEMKQRTGFMSNMCRDAANRMMASSGSSSFHNDQPLQRIWRDLNTVCSHAFWDWDTTRELSGKRELGMDLDYPLV